MKRTRAPKIADDLAGPVRSDGGRLFCRLTPPMPLVYFQHMNENSTADTPWDDLCKRCGRCCFEKWEDERGRITYTDIACRYLDVASRRCKIFEQRFTINPSCIKLSPELVQKLRWLPHDCGYRPSAPGLPDRTRRKRSKT